MFGEAKPAAAATMLAAAAAWPSMACALAGLGASPYDRALANAWCGAAPHGAYEVLGHCPACWAGATLLAALAALVMRRRPVRDMAPAYWAV
jgi:hypothetical protein